MTDKEIDIQPDDPLIPLHLLIWSIETSLTTLVCVVDVFSWPGYSRQEVLALQQLYVPYLLLGESFSLPVEALR